ncbi:hypothetical protein, partial [Klebsiella pneumoniae]|uniref:hypothetical protein n=1 Tax=Klebsiella pneumoniae TaxID=573 RepID=UPI00272FFB9E
LDSGNIAARTCTNHYDVKFLCHENRSSICDKLLAASRKPSCFFLQLVARNLQLLQSDIQQQTSRVFQQVLDGHQESH